MAQTVVDICNSALLRVGAASIMSLDDNSPEARACVVCYDSNRRAELRKYVWRFALMRARLAPDSDTPAFDYQYQFTLPADCLRVLPPDNDPSCDWSVEGRKVLTNYPATSSDGASPVLNLRYIGDVTDATQFDSAFYDVMSLSLASDLCEKLTQDAQKKAVIDREYATAVALARQTSAYEMIPQAGTDSGWLLARF